MVAGKVDSCLFSALAHDVLDRRPAQFEEAYYVGDRYVYEMHLKRNV